MSQDLKKKLEELYSLHQKPKNLNFTYGTAGFRTKANVLDSVVFVVGILAGLRSKYLDGQVIGIMITASHNPPEDNGIKLIDPRGEMLEQSWEPFATALANSQTSDELYQEIVKIASRLKIDLSKPSSAVVARDSRDSGPALVDATIEGLRVLDTLYQNFHTLTTPQLHYMVRAINTQHSSWSFGKPTEEGYYEKLTAAFKKLLENSTDNSQGKIKIIVDAANGIGAPKIEDLFSRHLSNYIDYEIVNDDFENPLALNVNCGADFVKTNQKLPVNINPIPLQLYASFDGDADRVVFYYLSQEGQFKLLDGDKISTLLAAFLKDLLERSNLSGSIGVVQTAYANGSSTNYLNDIMKIPVVCTSTGVKHLHHEAAKFDIGIYFEANGHGTVLFSDVFVDSLKSAQPSTPHEKLNIDILYQLSELINQTVGDAISDLLAVFVVLAIKQWGASDWDNCYTDLPNKLAKVVVPDRTQFKTKNAERELISPQGLQNKIDEIVKKYSQGRSFVRASGTEDAVRIYAEAGNRSDADDLSIKVCELVKEFT